MHDSSIPAAGLEATFLANRAALLRFLAARGAGEAAEDLLQELWIRVSTARTGPVAAPLAYLYRAANMLMIDRYRSQQQAARRDFAWAEANGLSDSAPAEAPSAERTLLGREALQRVADAIEALGPRASAAFRRHRLDGIPQREVAAELGVSLSTIESDLRMAYRTITQLREAGDEV